MSHSTRHSEVTLTALKLRHDSTAVCAIQPVSTLVNMLQSHVIKHAIKTKNDQKLGRIYHRRSDNTFINTIAENKGWQKSTS